MVRLIRLFLPVLFPSWRFFADVGASPRIEVFAGGRWTPAMKPSQTLSRLDLAMGFLWNPARNEALYLTALAERVIVERSGPAPELLTARLARIHPDAPYRIWLETGDARELAFESPRCGP